MKHKPENVLNDWVRSISQGRSHMPKKYERKMLRQYQSAETSGARQDALKELLAYHAASLASIAISVYYSTRGADWMDLQDLLQEAVLAFKHKLDTFDFSYDVRLITYYSRDVRTVLQRYVVDNAMDIRQGSVYLQGLAGKIAKIRREHPETFSVDVGAADIAERLGISEKTVHMVRQFTGVTIVGLLEESLESPYNNIEGHISLLDNIMGLFCNKVYSFEDADTTGAQECTRFVTMLKRGVPFDPDLLYALKQL